MKEGEEYILITENDAVYWGTFKDMDGQNITFEDVTQKRPRGTSHYQKWTPRRWNIKEVIKPNITFKKFKELDKPQILEEVGAGADS